MRGLGRQDKRRILGLLPCVHRRGKVWAAFRCPGCRFLLNDDRSPGYPQVFLQQSDLFQLIKELHDPLVVIQFVVPLPDFRGCASYLYSKVGSDFFGGRFTPGCPLLPGFDIQKKSDQIFDFSRVQVGIHTGVCPFSCLLDLPVGMADVLIVDNAKVRDAQVRRLHEVRNTRDAAKAQASMDALTKAAKENSGNLLELAIDATRNRVTVGELSDALEEAYGRHEPVAKMTQL